MKRTILKSEKNTYIFIIDSIGSLTAKGTNVFYALDLLKRKNIIDRKAKIESAFQKISKSNLVNITSILNYN